MPRKPQTPVSPVSDVPADPSLSPAAPSQVVSIPVNDLAAALAGAMTQAINASRPLKITTSNRKRQTPWTPKNGEVKLKLKRKFYQHSLPQTEDRLSNEEIALINKLRPGTYCEGWIKVIRRRDKGIDLDYPFKTAQHKTKLSNELGLRNLVEICERCISEAELPKKPQFDEDGDAI